MKILVSAYKCDPGAGSEPNLGYYFSAGLADAGHEVWCMTTPLARENIERETARLGHHRLRFVYLWPPIFGSRMYRSKIEMYCNYFAWQRRAALMARKLDLGIGFDAVHHITWGSLVLGSGMWRVGKPLFFGPAGGGQSWPPGFESYFGAAMFAERLRKVMTPVLTRINPDHRRTMKVAKCVFVSNADTADLAKASGCRNVVYLPDPALPVDWAISAPRTEVPGRLRLLWVGRLIPLKGPVLALEALALSRMPNWNLTIVGDGPMAAEVDAAIARLGLDSRIARTGRVDHSEMKAIYARHDVLLLTSLRDSCPSQLLEAMICGVPPVTFNLHGAAMFVPDGTGIKVDVTTPEATKERFARAIDELCRAPEAIAAMRPVARAAAERHLWPEKIRRIEEYYQRAGVA